MNYSFIISVVISTLLFIIAAALALYIIMLFILSKGFKISPTVSSNRRSIAKIKEYIQEYITKTNKKHIRILDIGSGYGKMLFGIAKNLQIPEGKTVEFVGYEISGFAYRISKFFNRYKNIKFIKDDANNISDFNFDIVLTFILKKQQKLFLNVYRKFPKKTLIIANSLPIPFDDNEDFKLVRTIRVLYRWNIYIYKNIPAA